MATVGGYQENRAKMTPEYRRLLIGIADEDAKRFGMKIGEIIREIIKQGTPSSIRDSKSLSSEAMITGKLTVRDGLVNSVTLEAADELKAKLAEMVLKELREAFGQGLDAATVQNEVDYLDVNWDMVDEDAVQFLQSYSIVLANKLSAEAEWELRGTVMDGIITGKGAKEIASDIEALGDDFAGNGMKIARSEGMRAMNLGRMTAFREAGIEEYVFIASDEQHWKNRRGRKDMGSPYLVPCNICFRNHGRIFRLGGGPIPPLHPDCRCTIGAVTQFTKRNGDVVTW